MPITQSRMIALLNAALAYRAAYNSAIQFISESLREIEAGRATPQQRFELMHYLYDERAVENYAQAELAIMGEAQHWRHAARRNDRARQRMAQQRGAPQRQQTQGPLVEVRLLEQRATTAPAAPMRPVKAQSIRDDLVEGPTFQIKAQRAAPAPELPDDEDGATLPPGATMAEDDNAPATSLDPRARHAALALLEGHGAGAAANRCKCGHEGSLHAHLESVGAAIAARGQGQ